MIDRATNLRVLDLNNKEIPVAEDKLNIEGIDSAPTFPMTEIVKVRASDLAASLTQAVQQGYVDANILHQLLDLAKMLLPLLMAA
jgi:uncharacterized protein YccT (UPF0319 family)